MQEEESAIKIDPSFQLMQPIGIPGASAKSAIVYVVVLQLKELFVCRKSIEFTFSFRICLWKSS